ncbi:hypothetical protein CHCC15337_4115 [Bacillus paralicheniformis]|nr:hypothetical protein CHCC4186_4264 [Bacillus paralicheniformis]TWL39479.1 hypothetical protein CHCC15337_4115 [Bacillus paralicheniformis]
MKPKYVGLIIDLGVIAEFYVKGLTGNNDNIQVVIGFL